MSLAMWSWHTNKYQDSLGHGAVMLIHLTYLFLRPEGVFLDSS